MYDVLPPPVSAYLNKQSLSFLPFQMPTIFCRTEIISWHFLSLFPMRCHLQKTFNLFNIITAFSCIPHTPNKTYFGGGSLFKACRQAALLLNKANHTRTSYTTSFTCPILSPNKDPDPLLESAKRTGAQLPEWLLPLCSIIWKLPSIKAWWMFSRETLLKHAH